MEVKVEETEKYVSHSVPFKTISVLNENRSNYDQRSQMFLEF